MLRRALPSLFCAFALAAPAYSQDVFVPRELKAQAVHPPKEHKPEANSEKPKETVGVPAAFIMMSTLASGLPDASSRRPFSAPWR